MMPREGATADTSEATPANPMADDFRTLAASPAESLPLVLDVAECADLLRVDRKTIRRMLKAGELRGARCGRHFRIPRVAVEELLGIEPPAAPVLALPSRAPALGRPGRPPKPRRASAAQGAV